MVAETFAHGRFASPVSVNVTVPDVKDGVNIVSNMELFTNTPESEEALHVIAAVFFSVARTMVMEGIVEQMVVSVAVTLGAETTITFIVAEVFAQGALALLSRVNVTKPDDIEGI